MKKSYNDIEELEKDLVNKKLIVDDDIGIYFDLVNDHITIEAHNINAYDIKVKNITAWNIDAWDVEAENIKADDITAKNIKANNIKANNIYAEKIYAENINYYVFCIALKSLIYKSIKGELRNSIHKCLDGKIVKKSELINIRKHEKVERGVSLGQSLENEKSFYFKDKKFRFNQKGVLMNEDAEPISLKEIRKLIKAE